MTLLMKQPSIDKLYEFTVTIIDLVKLFKTVQRKLALKILPAPSGNNLFHIKLSVISPLKLYKKAFSVSTAQTAIFRELGPPV